MKHLYLIRHAKSSWSDSRLSDFDRPLNKRGKNDAPFMGQCLASASIEFDLLISSSAKRARMTARLIAKEISYKRKNIIYHNEIYSSDLTMLLSVLRRTESKVNTLALVGHNHVITECAEWLTGNRIVNIPTSGIVAVSFDIKGWDEIDREDGTLLFFDYPKLHLERSSGG